MPLLEVKNCTKQFGGLTAVKDISLSLEPGELAGLIGPNGAGKTTAFNLLTGVYQPTSGTLLFNGSSIKGLKPHQIAARGISRTFQNIRLFPSLSALENVRCAQLHQRASLLEAILRTGRFQRQEERSQDSAMQLLEQFGLAKAAREQARNLSYGEQRRLEIARALASEPRLLLLDEPAAGMNPQEKSELMERILRIRSDFQVAILLIEHDMKVVMGICERIYALDYGSLIAQGSPSEIKSNPQVIEAYLGDSVALVSNELP